MAAGVFVVPSIGCKAAMFAMNIAFEDATESEMFKRGPRISPVNTPLE